MPATIPQILDQILEFELLDAGQIAQIQQAIAPRFPSASDFAKELVRQNYLTPFQANKIANGKAAELAVGPYRLLDQIGQAAWAKSSKPATLNWTASWR